MINNSMIRIPYIIETYVYNHPIDRVWEVIKDVNLYPFFSSGITNVKIIKGSNSYEIDNMFQMKFVFIDVT